MRREQHTICVIGGGFTGIAAAITCLSEIKQTFQLVVVEAKPSVAQGVAFGAADPMHLLNVRTRDLSIRAGQPGDFLNWAFRQLDQGENHADLHDGLAHTFLPRQLFGEYARQRFFEALKAAAMSRIASSTRRRNPTLRRGRVFASTLPMEPISTPTQ